MNDAAFETLDQASEARDLHLNPSALASWVASERIYAGLEDDRRTAWRVAMGYASCPAWEGGPEIMVPCFRLERRRLGAAAVHVTPVATAPSTAFCELGGPFEDPEESEVRLNVDLDDARRIVRVFMVKLADAVDRYRNRPN